VDLPDPDNRCGAWSSATFEGRPVVCIRAPRDARVARLRRKDSQHVTTIAPQQRTAVGRHRRELEVILASAPAGAAIVVCCTVPPATCGPPLHAHATSDETLYVLSGMLLVREDGQVAAIPKAAWCTSAGARRIPSRQHPVLRRAS